MMFDEDKNALRSGQASEAATRGARDSPILRTTNDKNEIGKAQKTADEKTCNVWQVCESNADATPDNPPEKQCADASKVTIPVFWEGNYAPAKMPEHGMNDFKTACPFYTDPD